MEPLKAELKAARKLIDDARSIVVMAHERPDGDAVGGLLALSLALSHAGKITYPVLVDGLPARYRFLPGSAEVLTQLPASVDLLVCVDCSDAERLGVPLGSLPRLPDINIDHHPTNTAFATVNLVDDQAAATCELLGRWLQDWGFMIDSPVAANLLTGLVTDTIGFRTPNVTPEVLRQAAWLIEQGAPLAEIYERTLNRQTLSAARYWAAGLSSLESQDGIVWATLTLQDRRTAGYHGPDDADLINLLSAIDGATVSLVFVEQPDGKVKVSWRARPGVDVAKVATTFGGGGHALAAGAMLDGDTAEVIGKVVAATRQALPSSRSEAV